MKEPSNECSGSGETCLARTMLIDKIVRKELLRNALGSELLIRPNLANKYNQSITIGKEILKQATQECDGEECFVIYRILEIF